MTGTPNEPPVPGQLDLVPLDLTEQEAAVRAELDRLTAVRHAGIVAAIDYVRGRRRALDEHRAQLDEAVAAARARGATWVQIGEAAGMTGPSAWERWAKR
jgi:hypothetical protein